MNRVFGLIIIISDLIIGIFISTVIFNLGDKENKNIFEKIVLFICDTFDDVIFGLFFVLIIIGISLLIFN